MPTRPHLRGGRRDFFLSLAHKTAHWIFSVAPALSAVVVTRVDAYLNATAVRGDDAFSRPSSTGGVQKPTTRTNRGGPPNDRPSISTPSSVVVDASHYHNTTPLETVYSSI